MKKKISYIVMILIMLMPIINVHAASFSSNTVTEVCGFDYMPSRLPGFTSGLYNILKLMVPVILIVMGMIDFASAVMASEEKKMIESQKKFINRLLAGVIVFFIMAIVQFVFRQLDTTSNYKNGFTNCMNCILNNKNCNDGTQDTRRKCQDYDGKDCPNTDDFGQKCKQVPGGSYGYCVVHGSDCSHFLQSECNNSKTNDNLSCVWKDGKCSQSCTGLGYSECIKLNYCKYEGTPPNSGVCKNK